MCGHAIVIFPVGKGTNIREILNIFLLLLILLLPPREVPRSNQEYLITVRADSTFFRDENT